VTFWIKKVLSQKQIQGMEIPLPYLYLSGDTKDLVDERDLSCHIIPSDILDLSFADHRHRFIAFEGHCQLNFPHLKIKH
jgi:hypothetical protein